MHRGGLQGEGGGGRGRKDGLKEGRELLMCLATCSTRHARAVLVAPHIGLLHTHTKQQLRLYVEERKLACNYTP